MTGIPATTTALTAQFPLTGGAGRYGAQQFQNIIATMAASNQVFLPSTVASITDGGNFWDGLTHPASANGFATLAPLQTAFQAASFTATGSGTNLTVSSVTGVIYPKLTLGVTTGIGAGITIVRQTSGTTGGAGVYVTSGSTTISAAAATASIARSTSDEMVGLMIQLAVQQAHLNGTGTVPLYAGPNGGATQFRLAGMGITSPPGTNAQLMGIGPKQNIILACGAVSSGTPAVSIYTQADCRLPVSNLTLYGFNTGRNFGSATNGGVAYTAMYNSGSVGVFFSQCSTAELYGVNIHNFDEAYGWDTTLGGNFSLSIIWSEIQECNHGVTLGASAPNSNEKMGWYHCSISNNNYGVYAIGQTSTTPGAGTPLGFDLYIFNCQIDYNIVNAVYYLGDGTGSLAKNTVTVAFCHVETNQTCSGTGVWCATDGMFLYDHNTHYISSGTVDGVVGVLGFWSSGVLTNNFLPGGFGNLIPLLKMNNNGGNWTVSNNTSELFSSSLIVTTDHGSIWGTPNVLAHANRVSGNFTLDASSTNQANGYLVSASLTVTVPPDSTILFNTTTKIPFTTQAGVFATFSAGAGVTITTSGTGLIVGGANPAYGFLEKTDTANTWLLIFGESLAGIIGSVKTASYTAAMVDRGTVVEMNVAGANNFTVPPNSSVAFDVGTVIQVHQYGAGATTIVAGAGVTLRSPSTLVLRTQYATAVLRKRATDEWIVSGDLT